MSGVLRTQLGGALRRPSRLILTGMAVIVASFVVYGTVLGQEITVGSLVDEVAETPKATSLVVTGADVTPDLVAEIEKVPGVTAVAGRTFGNAVYSDDFFTIVADPGAGPLATARTVQGHYPQRPDEIAVSPRTADRTGLSVGTTGRFTLTYDYGQKPPPPVALKVTGVVQAAHDDGETVYAPMATVLKLTGERDLRQINVQAAPADVARVRDAIHGLAPQSSIQDGREFRLQEAKSGVGEVIFTVIAFFLAIAVLAAVMVVASTFRIVFAQRMRQLALLRAVGAPRKALSRALAAEGALTGLLAGVVGVGAAQLVALAVPPVAAMFGATLASPGFPWAAGLGVIVMAVVITVIAVLAPARSASKVSPLEALRTATLTTGLKTVGRGRWVAGLLLTALAAALIVAVVAGMPKDGEGGDPPEAMLWMLIGSMAFAFFALISLGPVLVRPMLAAVGYPLRRLMGPLGRLAAGGVGGAPRRAAAVSVVVALGVTLMAGAMVFVESTRVTVARSVAMSAPADFQVTFADPKDPAVTGKVRARPELTHVVPYRMVENVTIGGDEFSATDVSMADLPVVAAVAGGSWRDLRPGGVVLTKWAADSAQVQTGDRTTIRTGKGTLDVTVTAVLADNAPLASLILAPEDLTRLGAPAGLTGVLADASRGGEQARTEAQKALKESAGSGNGTGLKVLADRRDEYDQQTDLILAVVIGLLSLTVLIAVVGVGTTVALSVVERSRESGILRAVGLNRGDLRMMLTAESGLYGVLGATMGLALGVPYAWLGIRAIGHDMPLSLPIGQLAIVFVALVAITAAAGVLPARRAAKISPVAALATE